MKITNIDDITPQQARVAFKGWSVKKQRKFIEQLLEEHAYYCGLTVALAPVGDNSMSSFDDGLYLQDLYLHKSDNYIDAFNEGYEHGLQSTTNKDQ